MANQKISELNSIGVGGLDDSDLFAVVDSSATETKHATWGSLKIPPLIGAKVRHSVNSTGLNMTSPYTLSWDSEVYDTHGFHASGATDYRFTIPPEFGGMYFDVSATMDCANTAADNYGDIIMRHYNAAGTQLNNFVSITESGLTSVRNYVGADGVLVDSGDYFQVEALMEDNSVDVTTKSEFTIRVVGQ